jgi:large subunit ribosomal protein L19e
MKLSVQKRLAANVLKCSPKRVSLAPNRSADIKEAITRSDIKNLIGEGLIVKHQEKGVSRARAKKRADQRRKGLQRGPGKRKGKKTAIVPRKTAWMAKIRTQRVFLKELKDNNVIEQKDYVSLYRKAKGGFFRNKRHIKIYAEEHNMFSKR